MVLDFGKYVDGQFLLLDQALIKPGRLTTSQGIGQDVSRVPVVCIARRNLENDIQARSLREGVFDGLAPLAVLLRL